MGAWRGDSPDEQRRAVLRKPEKSKDNMTFGNVYLTMCASPTMSEAQWSTTAKNQHQPSAFVQNRDASVPHNSSGL